MLYCTEMLKLQRKRLPLILACCAVLLAFTLALAGFLSPRQEAESQPETPPPPAISEAEIQRMIGQMIMVGFRGDGTKNMRDVPYVTELVRQGKLGGVILFNTDVMLKTVNRNVVDAKQLKKLISGLQAAASIPLFIAVDQEGGQVQRLKPEHGFTRWPYPEDMTRMTDAIVRQIGLEMGQELASVGINLNFAPGIDVNVNPRSPVIGMIGRSFSKNPAVVAQKAKAFMQGLNEAGVIGCFKHFPGHGSSVKDTHRDAADVTATWKETELEPYRALLGMPGEYGVMAAHVYNRNFGDAYPATLSPAIVHGLLRGELGWQGAVFTDDMQMQAITRHYKLDEAVRLALEAGVDVLVFGNNYGYQRKIGEDVYTAMLALYRDGKISAERIEASYGRIMKLKAAFAPDLQPASQPDSQPALPKEAPAE